MPSPVSLSADDAYHLERLADSMRRDAMDDYELFVSRDARRVDRAQWKPWKSHDGVALFRERSPSSSSSTKGKRLPRVLAVGAIRGSLNDVMYGIVTPTASAMRLKAAYLQHAEFLDAAVLHELQSATPTDPFRFLGLKWLLQRGAASSLLSNGLVRPRDFCYLEATGVEDVVSGSRATASSSSVEHSQLPRQRVGYHVMHSVELAQCPARQDGAVQRGAFSMCALYHELPHGRGVDVYMTALVEPRGHMLSSMAMRSAERLLRTQWRALSVCAESKKLAWLLQTQRQLAADAPSTTSRASNSLSDARHCGFCSKALGALAKRRTCQLCSTTVCTHCSVARTLRSPGLARDSVVAAAMLFCKRCLAVASEENASDIARQELWETSVVRSGRAQTLLELATRRHDVATALVQGSSVVAQSSLSSSSSNWNARHSLLHVPSVDARHYQQQQQHQQPPPRATERGHHTYAAASRRSETASRHHQHLQQRQSLPAKGFRRGSTTSNGTWLGSAYSRETLRTESLSLEGLDDDGALDAVDAVETHSSILPPPRPSVQLYDPQDVPFSTRSTDDHDAGRSSVASSASTALVLLNDRSALSRRLKELDYVDVDVDVDVDADLETRASSCAPSELEIASSRGSFCSSIAVMELDARRPQTHRLNALDDDNQLAFDERDEPEDDAREYDLDHRATATANDATPSPPNNEFIPLQLAPVSAAPAPLRRHHHSVSMLPRAPSSAPPALEMTPDASSSSANGSAEGSYQMQLWMQMNELRDAAESTYQVARRNTETLLSQNPQLRHLQFFAPAPRVGNSSSATATQPHNSVSRATVIAASRPPLSRATTSSSSSASTSTATPRSMGRSASVGARSEARFQGSLVL